MSGPTPEQFHLNVAGERLFAGLSQSELARAAHIERTKIVRMEAGQYVPRFDEVVRLAGVLGVPLQSFLTGHTRPAADARGLAFELNRLGIADYRADGARVPGAFRAPEEVLVLAAGGDRPDARLVVSLPFVLATHRFRAALVRGYAAVHDRRARARIGWLSDLTLALARAGSFPVPLRAPAGLERLVRLGRAAAARPAPDDLGHPAAPDHRHPPLWRRWRVTFGGTPDEFLARARELAARAGTAPGGRP